jgi:hypothetical protein
MLLYTKQLIWTPGQTKWNQIFFWIHVADPFTSYTSKLYIMTRRVNISTGNSYCTWMSSKDSKFPFHGCEFLQCHTLEKRKGDGKARRNQ